MVDKVVDTVEEALADIKEGASIAVAGFGIGHRFPTSLILGLRDAGTSGLTIVCNSLGEINELRAQVLAERKQISRLIASFSARPKMTSPAEEQIRNGEMTLELVPQGVLVERLRAAGAGLAAFYSPVGADTILAEDKEVRQFGGRDHVLEHALPVDFAFVRAHRADRRGNLQFRGGSQNFNPSFAKAARVVIAEVDEVVDVGSIAPSDVDLPGIFVDRVVASTVTLPEELHRKNAAMRRGNPDARRTYHGKPALSRAQVAFEAAALLEEGSHVNLGVGMPTLVSNHVTDRDIYLHAENGILGYAGIVDPESADPDVYNAGGQFVGLRPGASFFDSVESFEIARSGRLGAVLLGAYEVDARGSLANWTTPSMVGGGIGGAMDLAVERNRVIVLTTHCDSKGRPKLVERCSLPVTAANCVESIVTDLAVFRRVDDRFVLTARAESFSIEEISELTGFAVEAADDVAIIQHWAAS